MKKVLLSLAVLAAVVFALIKVSESDGRKEFLREIDMINRSYPQVTEWGKLISISVVDSNLVYEGVFSESIVPLEDCDYMEKIFNSNSELISRSMSGLIAGSFMKDLGTNEQKKIQKQLSAYVSKIVYDIKLPNGHRVSVDIPTDTLTKMIDIYLLHPDEILRQSLLIKIEIDNKSLPVKDGATLFKEEYLEGDDLVLLFEFDENLVDMEILKSQIREFEEELKKAFINDLAFKSCALYKVNLVIRYVGDQTGKSVDVLIPYDKFSLPV